MYELFKFLHVSTAIVWIGSGVGLLTLMSRLRASDRAGLMAVLGQMQALGKGLFAPAAVATLVFGIVTVLLGDWDFESAWIVIGFVGFAVSFVLSLVRNPVGRKIGAAIQQHGPDHADVDAGISRVRMIGLVDVVVLFAVVAAMVFKPGA